MGNPGWTLLWVGVLLAGTGCQDQSMSPGRAGDPNAPSFQGGPMPLREAQQVARRCVGNLPPQEASDPKLRKSFEERIVILLAAADPVRRAEAAEELGELRRREAVEALLLAAGDGEPAPSVRTAAITSLGWIGEESCAPSVAERLKDSDAEVRIAAAKTLARLNNPATTSALSRALADPDARVRSAVVGALGWLRDTKASYALSSALEDQDPAVRASAAGSLGLLGDSRSVPALVQALQDPSPLVRYLSASALGKLGDPQAIAALEPLRKDSDPAVRKAAHLALEKLKKTR